MFLVGVLPTDIFSVAPIIYIGYWESKTLSLMMNRNDLKKKKKIFQINYSSGQEEGNR